MLGKVTDIGDGPFHRGEAVWVLQADGSQRAAEYVGVGESSAWFGGPPQVIVVYPDTHSGETVEVDRVLPRDGFTGMRVGVDDDDLRRPTEPRARLAHAHVLGGSLRAIRLDDPHGLAPAERSVADIGHFPSILGGSFTGPRACPRRGGPVRRGRGYGAGNSSSVCLRNR